MERFTIATLMGQLLVVGGVEKSTQKKTNKILGFLSKQWVSIQYPAMPTALTYPAVIGYLDHLVVAGGNNSERNAIPDVNILNTTSNKWKTAQPLPSTSEYYTVLIDDSMYLVGRDTQTVIRAHVPTLISGAKSDVWETLSKTPYSYSNPVTIGNTLLIVGGKDKPSWDRKPTTSVQMYDPTANKWTRFGHLSELMSFPFCVILNSEIFVLQYRSMHLHVSTLHYTY